MAAAAGSSSEDEWHKVPDPLFRKLLHLAVEELPCGKAGDAVQDPSARPRKKRRILRKRQQRVLPAVGIPVVVDLRSPSASPTTPPVAPITPLPATPPVAPITPCSDEARSPSASPTRELQAEREVASHVPSRLGLTAEDLARVPLTPPLVGPGVPPTPPRRGVLVKKASGITPGRQAAPLGRKAHMPWPTLLPHWTPAVRVLREGPAPETRKPFLGVTHVVVLGDFKTNTKTMCHYLHNYFKVHVEPDCQTMTRRRKGAPKKALHEGVIDMREAPVTVHGVVPPMEPPYLWKHIAPTHKLNFEGTGAGSTLVIVTVREPLHWMEGLSAHAYNLRSNHFRKRKAGSFDWMMQAVRCEPEGGWAYNPAGDVELHYDNMVHRWVSQTVGWLGGQVASNGGHELVMCVRHEDLLFKPSMVVQELEKLGLPRNSSAFQPIDRNVSEHHNRLGTSRQDLQEHYQKVLATTPKDIVEGVQAALAGYQPLLAYLGYADPWNV